MNLRTRIVLATFSVTMLTGLVASWFDYRSALDGTTAEAAADAHNVRALLMSMRRVYHQQFLTSGIPLTDRTVGFLPAHAMSRIARDLENWTTSGLYFNNVSDRPRNAGNRADKWEMDAMGWFRANPQATERVANIRTDEGKEYYHYTAAIRIEEYCLKCHGDPADAPEAIRSNYEESFGYKLGELRGIMSIKVPMERLHERAWKLWRNDALTLLISFALAALVLAILIERLVIRRLVKLGETAAAVANGDYTARATVDGGDEVARLATSLNQASAAVERRNNELQRFAEISAHHLQEPARRVAIFAERLAMRLAGKVDDEEARLALEFIGRDARRQRMLLRDIERYLAAGQPRGAVVSGDTRLTVHTLLGDLAGEIAAAGAEISLADLPAACLDAPRLEDVFRIAIENALRFAGAGERPLRIVIAGEKRGEHIRYSVSDNGPGVPVEYRERVFRVFERLSSVDETTGVGLAILRRIVESTPGGRAWIEEAPGGGCRILFELPAGESV